MIDAFLLAWFTHLTTKILADLQYHLFGPDAMIEMFENKPVDDNKNENEMNGKDDNNSEISENKPASNKIKDHRRRRRRLFIISDSEGSDLSENENDLNGNDSESEESLSELSLSDDDSDEDLLIEESEPLISGKFQKVFMGTLGKTGLNFSLKK